MSYGGSRNTTSNGVAGASPREERRRGRCVRSGRRSSKPAVSRFAQDRPLRGESWSTSTARAAPRQRLDGERAAAGVEVEHARVVGAVRPSDANNASFNRSVVGRASPCGATSRRPPTDPAMTRSATARPDGAPARARAGSGPRRTTDRSPLLSALVIQVPRRGVDWIDTQQDKRRTGRASARPVLRVGHLLQRCSALEQELDGVAEEVLHLFAELRVLLEVGVGVEDLPRRRRAPRSRSARPAGAARA